MAKTKEDRIKTVMNGDGQVVILGAGASIASTHRNPKINGKKLPSMDNFIEIVGLQDLVEKIPGNLVATNFEELYSNLHNDNPKSDLINEIEQRVIAYFPDMQLPPEPTIYDYLVLSLRGQDLIATFNWDPFLYQAWIRNKEFTDDLPHLSFLHGNVAIGYSKENKRCGPAGMYMRRDGGYFEPTKLLYPVNKKTTMTMNSLILNGERLKYWLDSDVTKLVTVFGYGAPKSNLEAVKLMSKAWGTGQKRNMEQFEIIDI